MRPDLTERKTLSQQSYRPRDLIIGFIVDRVAEPGGDGGFAPPCTSSRNPYLPRERAGLNLPVQRRRAKAGAVEHAVEAQNAIVSIGCHGMALGVWNGHADEDELTGSLRKGSTAGMSVSQRNITHQHLWSSVRQDRLGVSRRTRDRALRCCAPLSRVPCLSPGG